MDGPLSSSIIDKSFRNTMAANIEFVAYIMPGWGSGWCGNRTFAKRFEFTTWNESICLQFFVCNIHVNGSDLTLWHQMDSALSTTDVIHFEFVCYVLPCLNYPIFVLRKISKQIWRKMMVSHSTKYDVMMVGGWLGISIHLFLQMGILCVIMVGWNGNEIYKPW